MAETKTVLEIKSTRASGRYRAGRFWPAHGTLVGAEQFTKEQLKQLQADPVLVVTEVKDQPKK